MIDDRRKFQIIIKEYATGVAAKLGVKLTKISVVEGPRIGCTDVHLLKLSKGNKITSALVYESELHKLQNGFQCDRLETKLRSVLSRL